MFGRGLDGTLSPSLLTLDVSNVSNITYTANYNDDTSVANKNPNTSTSITDTTSTNTTHINDSNGTKTDNINSENKSTGLSHDALGGIVAGCVITVSIVQLCSVNDFIY